MNIKIEWKAKPDDFGKTGYQAFVGSINVGGTRRGKASTRGGSFMASIRLPDVSIPETYRNQLTEANARKVVEVAVNKWFERFAPGITE